MIGSNLWKVTCPTSESSPAALRFARLFRLIRLIFLNVQKFFDFWISDFRIFEKKKKQKKTKFGHKPSFAWSCDFLVLSIEFAKKNYIESWGSNLRRARISKLELGPGVEDKQPDQPPL